MRAQDPKSADPSRNADSPKDAGSGGAALSRIGWMVVGPVAMLVATLEIASTPHWTFGPTDIVLVSGAVLAIGCRYWDIREFGGQTAKGEPATMAMFWRYFVALSAIAIVCWAAAHSVHV